MIQDAGYYYPDFDISIGADKLKWVLKNHDDNIEEYNSKNQEILKRYTIENKKMINVYRKLLNGLYDESPKINWKYNWRTNLIS
jgi:hypothetical protein